MKRIVEICLAFLAGATFAVLLLTLFPKRDSTTNRTPGEPTPSRQPSFANVSASPTPALPTLSPDIPLGITFTGDKTLPGLQRDFDVLSWNTFVALNWPAKPNGQ